MRYKAVFFDLDGTLVDTLDDLTAAMNAALATLGQPERSREECREMIGRGLGEYARAALPAESGHLRDTLLGKMKEIYVENCLKRTAPYAGIKEVLSACQKAGVRLAVVSNKSHPMTVKITEHYFGPDVFTEIFGQKEGIPCKPDPAPMQFLLGKMDLMPSEVLYVGDSDVDVETARNSKIDFVGVSWGFRSTQQLQQAGAGIIINQPVELLEYLRS